MSRRIVVGFLILFALSAFAQRSWYKAVQQNAGIVPAASGGGGGGPVAGVRPAIYTQGTNGDAAATSTMSITLGTDANHLGAFDLIYVDWYSNSSSGCTLTSLTDNGNACSQYTNGVWFSDNHALWRLYVAVNPANVSRTVTATWSANPGEKTLSGLGITNGNTTTFIRSGVTNYTSNISVTPLTFTTSSGTSDLVICGGTTADAVITTWALSANTLPRTTADCGANTHSSILGSTNSSASSVTTTITHGNAGITAGGFGISLQVP